ncbi:MAG TPA: hypothetical protein PKL67_13505 [Anaerolineae bacterium]|nr:hypothetical protein [Anaerolineae bacterium]
MEEAAALEAVRKPAELGARPFAPGVAEKLVEDLLQVRVPGQQDTVKGQYVEPVQLQVVCYQLWQTLTVTAPLWRLSERGKKPVHITFEDLEKAGDVNQALESFYDDTIQDTVEKLQQTPDAPATGARQLRSWFEEELITDVGTRNLVRQAETMTGSLPNGAVRELQRRFLVRTETRSGDAWVELIHDRFVEPVRASNLRWRADRRREQPWIDAAYSWHESGDRPETRNAGLLLADLNLKTVLQDTAGQQFEHVIMEYLEASKEAQEKRDQEAALGALRVQAEEERKRANLEAQAAEALRRQAAAETERANLEARTAKDLERQRIALAALAGVITLLLLTAIWLALQFDAERKLVVETNKLLTAKTDSLEISRTQLISLNQTLKVETTRANAEADRANAAQDKLQSVTLARIVSRLALESSAEQRVFALLLSRDAMVISPTLEAVGASIKALDAAYRHSDGWQPDAAETLVFSETLALPFTDALTLTVSADGSTVAAVDDGKVVIAQAEEGAPSGRWLTRSISTTLSRITALAMNADGTLIAAGGCEEIQTKPNPGDKDSSSKDSSSQPALVCENWRVDVVSVAGDDEFLRILRLEDHRASISALAFHPRLSQLVSADRNGDLLLWNLPASEPTPRRLNPDTDTDDFIVDLLFSPDGKDLIALYQMGDYRAWSWVDSTPIDADWRPLTWGGSGQAIALVRDGQWLASASACQPNDGPAACSELQIWDRESTTPLGLPIRVNGTVQDLAFDERSGQLWTAAGNNLVRMNFNTIDDWPQLVCQRAGRNMTADEWREAYPGRGLDEYAKTCDRYEVHRTAVQPRIDLAAEELNDCAPQGTQEGWRQLQQLAQDLGEPPRLPDAVAILLQQALEHLAGNSSDERNQAAAECFTEANALLQGEGQPEIPLDEAQATAMQLLDAENKIASEPQQALQTLQTVSQSLERWSVNLDDRLGADFLKLCDGQRMEEACTVWRQRGAPGLLASGASLEAILRESPGAPWYIEGKRGQGVTISMEALSDRFDAILELQGPDGNVVAINDDFGGTLNSRIETALPKDGLYRIIPKAWSGNGAYRLTVETRDLPTLQAGTPAFGGTGSQEVWLFAGTAGQIVSLDMTTNRPELGPTMTLARVGDTSWSPSSAFVSSDVGGRIDPLVLPADDLYLVTAGLYGSGSFSVTLNSLEARPLVFDQAELFDDPAVWALDAAPGQIIRVSLVTSDTVNQPVLELLSGRGALVKSAVSDPESGATVIDWLIPPSAERYYLRVSGVAADAPYRLRADQIEPGILSIGDRTESATDQLAFWTLDAAPGQLVQITLDAVGDSDLDPLVRLLKPDGQEIASDDDAGVGRNSALTLVLPDSPGYLVQADRWGGSGAFTLAAAELIPSPLPLDGSSVEVVADRAWRVSGRAGQALTVEIADGGDGSWPSLELATSGGATLASNDYGPRLTALLPQDGDYFLLPRDVADSGLDAMTATLVEAPNAADLNDLASRSLRSFAGYGAVDAALDLYRWGAAGGGVQFTADARNALCWFGALRGAAVAVIEICETLPDASAKLDPATLAAYRDTRGLARALTGEVEGAIDDFEYFAGNGDDSYQRQQRARWAARLRAGEPAADVFDAATVAELLRR